jgi:hypothetical protein
MREGRLTKWSDRKAEFRPTAGNWGGDNQCIAENGEYKTTCSNSLATMDSVGKRERERERERISVFAETGKYTATCSNLLATINDAGICERLA